MRTRDPYLLGRRADASGTMRPSSWLAILAMLLAALCIAAAYKPHQEPTAKQGAAAKSMMVEEL